MTSYVEQAIRGAAEGAWNGTFGGWLQMGKLAVGGACHLVTRPRESWNSVSSGVAFACRDPRAVVEAVKGVAIDCFSNIKDEFEQKPVEVTTRIFTQLIAGRVLSAWLLPKTNMGLLSEAKNVNARQLIAGIRKFVETGDVAALQRIGIPVSDVARLAAKEIREINRLGFVGRIVNRDLQRRVIEFGEQLASIVKQAEGLLDGDTAARLAELQRALVASRANMVFSTSAAVSLATNSRGDGNALQIELPGDVFTPQNAQASDTGEEELREAEDGESVSSLPHIESVAVEDAPKETRTRKIERCRQHLEMLEVKFKAKQGRGSSTRARAASISSQIIVHRERLQMLVAGQKI
ncbi:MAG: hypothetical protein H7A36_01460 [Chlamydiales bacterium]|nr:hypothetical protein [Chlamydiales bacterium]